MASCSIAAVKVFKLFSPNGSGALEWDKDPPPAEWDHALAAPLVPGLLAVAALALRIASA